MPPLTPRTIARIEHGIQSGEHFGAQLCVSRQGETLVDLALGQNAPFVPLERDHLLLWLSACKPVAAVAMALLVQRGLLDLDRPVAEMVPAFALRGKSGITTRHLLTHTAGIRGSTLGWTPRPWTRAIEMVCATKPEPHWVPGERAGYHVDNAWYMLAELVHVLDGRRYANFLREEIFLPLDMPDCWVGVDPEAYEAYEDRIGWMYNFANGAPVIEEVLCSFDAVTQCRPGGNGRGPANQFIRFYEALLRMVGGEPGILSVERARDLVAPHRVGMEDRTFRAVMDWGLGIMLNSEHYAPGETPYQFGPHASRQAFGHCGNQSTAAFADPAHGLAVVVLFNGMPGEDVHQARMRQTLAALYEDLDLVPRA